jgi:hypothetical protein
MTLKLGTLSLMLPVAQLGCRGEAVEEQRRVETDQAERGEESGACR